MSGGRRFIDGDALSVARAEAAGEPPVWRFGGDEYELPVELPWSVVESMLRPTPEDDIHTLKLLLGEEGYKRAVGAGATRPDFEALLLAVYADAYGVDPEAQSSSLKSSVISSESSKPTSDAPTDSASKAASGAKTRAGSENSPR